MMYGLLAVIIGVVAILYAKFVLPKMQEKMTQQAAQQKEKREAKKAEKEAQKNKK